uniref:Protein kinase n=1 Tax=Solanum tuberosum TaxID=4113 RepID=M1DKA7_SOLTU
LHDISIKVNARLFQLTSLLLEIGLNIHEDHALSTKDGYSLDVFVVDGWDNEETDRLRSVLLKEISNMDGYKGSFHYQEVAIKVLKSECLNEDVQRDFAEEIYIFR